MVEEKGAAPVPRWGWRVVFPVAVLDKAQDKIDALPDERSRRLWQDHLDRYIRDVSEFPYHQLGWPPRRTDDPKIWRFPAARTAKVSGWARLDMDAKLIEVGAIVFQFEREMP